VIVIISIVIIIIPMISANVFEWFKKTFTGKATSNPQNVSVTVTGGTKIVVETIDLINKTYIPQSNSFINIRIYATLYDADGVNDINDSSVKANYSRRSDETIRVNNSCTLVGDLDNYRANFTCVIKLWYWDGAGIWNISVSGNDLGNLTRAHNISEVNFTYEQLKSMDISPPTISWDSITASATNEKADNDPTIVNNSGNYNGTIEVTGIDLSGETIATEYIFAENFTCGPVDDCATSGTALVNASATTITNTAANRGNLSAGAGNETLFWCIPAVASVLSSQVYSTNNTGSWTLAY